MRLILYCALFLGFVSTSCSNEAELRKTEQELADAERVKLEAEASREQALLAYNEFLKREFSDWQLVGDDLDREHIGSRYYESGLWLTTHISKGNANKEQHKVITVFLERLKRPSGDEYWVAYRPNSIQLGELELEGVKREEFESGQVNPE